MKINQSFINAMWATLIVVAVGLFAFWSWHKMSDNKRSGFIETGVPAVTEKISGITPDKPQPVNLTTLSGKTYRHFSVQKVYPESVLIRHEIKPGDLSLAMVKFSDLDLATRKQLGLL